MKTALAFVLAASVLAAQPAPPVRAFTVDDEMAMRSLVDVAIAPDGSRVAYVVATPNLGRNEHDGALFIVATAGPVQAPVRIAETLKIFNTPTPRPQLHWSFDSQFVALLGATATGPQVFAGAPAPDAVPRQLTSAPEGV